MNEIREKSSWQTALGGQLKAVYDSAPKVGGALHLSAIHFLDDKRSMPNDRRHDVRCSIPFYDMSRASVDKISHPNSFSEFG